MHVRLAIEFLWKGGGVAKHQVLFMFKSEKERNKDTLIEERVQVEGRKGR